MKILIELEVNKKINVQTIGLVNLLDLLIGYDDKGRFEEAKIKSYKAWKTEN